MAKREAPPTEATALEALLRGDGILDKRNNNSKEEETLLEIQVTHRQSFLIPIHYTTSKVVGLLFFTHYTTVYSYQCQFQSKHYRTWIADRSRYFTC